MGLPHMESEWSLLACNCTCIHARLLACLLNFMYLRNLPLAAFDTTSNSGSPAYDKIIWTILSPQTKIVLDVTQSSLATIRGQLLFKGSYYSRAATIRGWLLFLWKTRQHQRWLEKAHKTAIQWRLLEAVSGKRSLSVPLSVMETSRTTQTALALAWWPSSEIICIHACVCSAYTGSSCGYSRAGFISLRDPDYCMHSFLPPASINA